MVADFRIVPPVGLVLAGVVLAGLVVVVATDAVWPLDFMHIVLGSAWTGSISPRTCPSTCRWPQR